MQTVTKALLLEYHAGRATPLQAKLIEDWLKDSANEALFYETLFDWEASFPQYLVDTESAAQRYKTLMQAPQPLALRVSHRADMAPGRRYLSAWMVAASTALLALAGGWIFREPILFKTYKTSYGQMQHIRLDDGSKVTLNANSSIRIPRFFFAHREREVELTGEAEFSVVHTVNHLPFRVKTERKVDVEVLGTEFLVFSRTRATRVVLNKGKVKLMYQNPHAKRQQLMMRPGEQAILTPKGDLQLKNGVKPQEAIAWKDHRFVFNDTPLREIGYMIQENYGLNVAISSPALAGRMVSGTFEASDANELLLVLQQLLDIEITKKKNKVTFSEKSPKS